MARGFVYLVAVMDWFSRRVLAWRLSIALEAEFCVAALRDALEQHGRPEIFNSPCEGGGQGLQFTSAAFVDELRARRAGQHGRPRSVPRQHLHRAAVAQPEV
jgi:putative transposase